MIVEIDGQRYDVPDDATPDEIGALTAPPAGPKMGKGQAFGAGITQGATFNFGDEIEGGIQALLRKYIERDPEAANKTLGQVYESERNYRRKENDRASTDQRGAYLGGNVAGGLLTVPLLPGAAPAGGTAGLLSAAKVGAAYGAASGAGRAETMADVPGAMATDAAVGAVAGPALGAASRLVGRGVSAGVNAVRNKLAETALEQGRKALTGNAGTISVKKLLSPESVAAAYESGAIRPGATVKGIAERLGEASDAAATDYSQVVGRLANAGVEGPKVSKLALEISDEARQMVQTANPAPDMFRGLAGEVAAEPAAAATGRLPLTVAEDIKRNLQNAARAEYVKEGATSLTGDAKRAMASRLRQAVEDAIDQQAGKAPADAAAFVPVKRRLGALLEASGAADTAAARAARKSNVGLVPAIAASGGMASGGLPMAALAGALAKAMQTRGASTVGSVSNFLANRIPAMTPPSNIPPGAISAEVRALLDALATRPGLRLSPAGAGEENR